MSDLLDRINEINKAASAWNQKARDAKARQELLLEQLKDQCSAYKDEYGINLWGTGDVNEIVLTVQAELDKVSAEVEKQLDLAEKILHLNETGNYQEARALLGLHEKSEQMEKVSTKGPVFDADGDAVLGEERPEDAGKVTERDGVVDATEEPEASVMESVGEASVDDGHAGVLEDIAVANPKTVLKNDKGLLILDEDDVDDDVILNEDGTASTWASTGVEVDYDEDAIDGGVYAPAANSIQIEDTEEKDSKPKSIFIDDDEEDGDLEEFKNLLVGSPFKIED